MPASTPSAVPFLPFVRPDIDADAIAAVGEVLASGWITSGPKMQAFEAALSALFDGRPVRTFANGSATMEIALRIAGIGPGDEVITTAITWVATANVIVAVGARPVFVDIDPRTRNLDLDAVEAAITPRTRAILPVYLAGLPVDMDRLYAIARKNGLRVIEDAAQAIGSKFDGKRAGSLGDFNCFSTHPLKNLNGPGDGGFITTNDSAAALRMRRYRNHGLVDRNTVGEWGVVARMDNIQAAVLSVRLAKLDRINERKRDIAAIYRKLLDPAHAFIAPCRQIEYNTFQTMVIQVDRRDELQRHLAARDIQSAIHYPIPIHLQPCATDLGYKRGQFPVTERQAERILSIPSYPTMTDADVERVAATINAFYRGKG